MPPKVPTNDELQEAVDLIAKYGTPHLASKHGNVPDGTLRNRIRLAKEKGIVPSGIDGQEHMNLAATSTLYDEQGNIRLQWIKTKEDKERYVQKIREMVDAFKKELPKAKKTKALRKDYNQKLMTFYPMGDPHFGMYAWAAETGDEDFNVERARADLCGAVEYLVSQGPNCEKCAIINLGDFFHYDTPHATTTKGTPQDTDTRIAHVIQSGVAALRKAIETALEKHKLVEVVCSQGNHDEVLSLALAVMLSHIYEKEPRVKVHDAPTKRHYIRHGKCLVGITHGDKTKATDLPLIMATEMPEDWGETTHRYYYRGHEHHSKIIEYNGCEVETFRTLAPGDAWTKSKGYLSKRDMRAIVLHEDYGEVSRFTSSISLLRDLSK